jgi:CxxC-x17-CxxC domain-containing protein
MNYEDKTLQCSDCGATFTFTAGEQEFFATKGYTNEPKRCPGCRQARKSTQGGGSYRPQREMYPAICAECGQETEVPFEPRQGRPVYCKDCYAKIRPGR